VIQCCDLEAGNSGDYEKFDISKNGDFKTVRCLVPSAGRV
jgi:hypothetical protein